MERKLEVVTVNEDVFPQTTSSLFFISPSNKTRENSYARDRRRETGKELKKKYRLLAVYISK